MAVADSTGPPNGGPSLDALVRCGQSCSITLRPGPPSRTSWPGPPTRMSSPSRPNISSRVSRGRPMEVVRLGDVACRCFVDPAAQRALSTGLATASGAAAPRPTTAKPSRASATNVIRRHEPSCAWPGCSRAAAPTARVRTPAQAAPAPRVAGGGRKLPVAANASGASPPTPTRPRSRGRSGARRRALPGIRASVRRDRGSRRRRRASSR